MRTQSSIEVEESLVGMACARSSVVHRRLGEAVSDDSARPHLYASLLSRTVFLDGVQILLTDGGPQLEFVPVPTSLGPAVVVYSSRSRCRTGDDVEAIPFEVLLETLCHDVRIVLDPAHECLVIDVEDLHRLRVSGHLRHRDA